MSRMMNLILRRIAGIILVGFAIAYWVAKWQGYDLPGIDLPQWMHSPAWWTGIAVVAVWAWLPVLAPVGNREVSLAQEMPRQFQSPQQIENEPFEMNGMW